MVDSDFVGLPQQTQNFVERLHSLGIDRQRIHGLFVILGLCVAAPDTQEKYDENHQNLEPVVPIDRSINIDEQVGHIHRGYDWEISEFIYRTGLSLKFREIKIPKVAKPFHIVDLKNHGLLNVDVVSMEKLADASHLYDAFLLAIGRQTANEDASLMDAYRCGIVQIQQHALSDVSGTRQIAGLIKSSLPLFYSQCFYTLLRNQIDYFLCLERGQIALKALINPMEESFARQMWVFQSSLFFPADKPIDGVDKLDVREWYRWVLANAEQFDHEYPSQLRPFSASNITLTDDVPSWGGGVRDFATFDSYIFRVWGYRADYIVGDVQLLEYKALTVHVIYASLTSTREAVH